MAASGLSLEGTADFSRIALGAPGALASGGNAVHQAIAKMVNALEAFAAIVVGRTRTDIAAFGASPVHVGADLILGAVAV